MLMTAPIPTSRPTASLYSWALKPSWSLESNPYHHRHTHFALHCAQAASLGPGPQQTRLPEQVGNESKEEAPGKGAGITLPAPRDGQALVLALFCRELQNPRKPVVKEPKAGYQVR